MFCNAFGSLYLRIGAMVLLALAALSAAAPATAQYARWQFPQQYILSPHGVNLQTGSFMASSTDLTIGNISLVRNWGSVPSITVGDRSFGALRLLTDQPVTTWAANNNGWSHNFNQGVRFSLGNDARYFVVADGKMYNFRGLLDGSIVPAAAGSSGTMLAWVNGQWNFTDRSGNLFVYFAHPSMSQNGAQGSPNQLIQSITYANGSRLDFVYNPAGRPQWVSSNSGFAIKLEYSGSGNVSAACGFNLSAAFASPATACASAALRVSYAYDPAGIILTSVTDVLNQVTTITYSNFQSQWFFPTCISLPNSATCTIRNDFGPLPGESVNVALPDQVRRLTTANGDIWNYFYRPQQDPADLPIVLGMPRYSRSGMTDPMGNEYGLRFDRGRLIDQTTPAGALGFRYKYAQVASGVYTNFSDIPQTVEYFSDEAGLVIMPEGNMDYYAYDDRGNIVMRSSWPKGSVNPLLPGNPDWQRCCLNLGQPVELVGSLTRSRTYLGNYGAISQNGFVFVLGCGSGPADAKLCDKPLTETDNNGGVVSRTYAQAHGGILTETRPTVSGIQPYTRYTYTQRFAWTRNSTGSFVRSTTGVWLLTQNSTCIHGGVASSGSGCAVADDEVSTNYDYGPDSGPNNLLLRGMSLTSGGQTLRTCYSYDDLGRKISETAPRAGLAVCP